MQVAGVINGDTLLGGLILRKPLGKIKQRNFNEFCMEKGTVEINGTHYPRLQILSVPDILEGKRFDTLLARGRQSTDQLRLL